MMNLLHFNKKEELENGFEDIYEAYCKEKDKWIEYG